MTEDEKSERVNQLFDDINAAVIELEGGYFNGDYHSLWAALNELRELTTTSE